MMAPVNALPAALMSAAVLGLDRIVATRAMVRMPPRTSKKSLTFTAVPQILDFAVATAPLTMAESSTPRTNMAMACHVKNSLT